MSHVIEEPDLGHDHLQPENTHVGSSGDRKWNQDGSVCPDPEGRLVLISLITSNNVFYTADI